MHFADMLIEIKLQNKDLIIVKKSPFSLKYKAVSTELYLLKKVLSKKKLFSVKQTP